MSLRGNQHYPSKKSRLIGGLDNLDLLSNLHESILSQILCILPIKDQFRTRILSKNWKFKWRCIDHMELVDFAVQIFDPKYKELLSYSESRKDDFSNFVEMIVLSTHDIKSFSLTCNLRYDAYRVKTWIYDLLRPDNNIEKLNVVAVRFLENKIAALPWSLLDKHSLKNLTLKLPGFTLSFTSPNYALKLTNFHLCDISVVLNKNSSCHTLMLNFPALEIFEVKRCKWLNVKLVKINAPVLYTYISETTYGPKDYSFEILSSKLSTYKSSGYIPDNITFTSSQITSASFSHGWIPDHMTTIALRIKKVLDESSSLNELQLSGSSVGALLSVPVLHQYPKLKRLILSGGGGRSGSGQLFELLYAMPSLEFLSVDLTHNAVTNYRSCDELELDLVPVPSCIISHLQEFEFLGYLDCRPRQHFLAMFFFEEMSSLEKSLLAR